jgi:polysaccharide export outer membrane protein
LLLALCVGPAGCRSGFPEQHIVPGMPRELNKSAMPEHVIEPPDILLIDALTVVPKPPYRVQPGDRLLIQAQNVFPIEPIAGIYGVDSDGTVKLGVYYGSASVVGLSIEQARDAIQKHLRTIAKNARVNVSLAQSRAMQQIAGRHLVKPDGRVSLGLYGDVPVAGLTIAQARAAIEQHLSQFLLSPEIAVDVASYNSKVYYIVLDQGTAGEIVSRFPIMGNDTVLSALTQAGGVSGSASKYRIWIARPVPYGSKCDQIIPVDWPSITARARTETNYQLFPNDRLYVQMQPSVAFNNYLDKIFGPVEALSGKILLIQGAAASLGTGAENGILNGTGTGIIR